MKFLATNFIWFGG